MRNKELERWKGVYLGAKGVGLRFSDPIPPQACMEVTMHDTAEGC